MKRTACAAVRLLVTGPPGTGKTTLCSKVNRQLRQVLGDDSRISGFLSQEKRNENGQRVGFDMVSLDGSQRDALASVDGVESGPKVGKSSVQLQEFEALTFPILDKVLSESGREGSPRVLIFDEIGEMELSSAGFVDRVRQLLTSPDPDLHVLATVALRGNGIIRGFPTCLISCKRLPGLRVVEIDTSSRDEVSSRFTQAMYDEVSSRSTQAWLHSQSVWQTSQSERMANKHRRVDHPPANSGSAYNLGNPDHIPRSHREFLEYKGSQVVQGFRNAKNLNLFHGKMRFAKNPPHEPADDGSFIVHWSRWDSVSNAFDWSTGLDYIVRELSDISIGQRLALQVKNAFEGKKVDAGIKQLENALLTKKVVVAIAEERYPISSPVSYTHLTLPTKA